MKHDQNNIRLNGSNTQSNTANLRRTKGKRRGAVLIYATMAMTGFIGICSLGVDYGRVQLAKSSLQAAADGAARAGAGSLASGSAAAVAKAKWLASTNNADGTPVALQAADIEVGKWDTTSRTFTVLGGSSLSQANAVHVIARRTAARGDGIGLSLASMIGIKTCDVKVDAIAMVVPAVDVNQQVRATSNPFLAGAPEGAVSSLNNPHNSPDRAGNATDRKQSPDVVNVPLTGGQVLTFDSIDGTARHDPSMAMYEPDGQLNDIGHNNPTPSDSTSYGTNYYNDHGIADVRAPINALVGVFLNDSQPDSSAAPANLDFSSEASRDFSKLAPKMKQIFFIGDGLNSSGAQQQFEVPQGATRLVLATWDFYEWNNNAGNRTVKVERPQQIVLVK